MFNCYAKTKKGRRMDNRKIINGLIENWYDERKNRRVRDNGLQSNY